MCGFVECLPAGAFSPRSFNRGGGGGGGICLCGDLWSEAKTIEWWGGHAKKTLLGQDPISFQQVHEFHAPLFIRVHEVAKIRGIAQCIAVIVYP